MRKHKVEYPEDCERIVMAAFKLGYQCSLLEAEDLWMRYSESMAAGWMCLPTSDTELKSIVNSYIKEGR